MQLYLSRAYLFAHYLSIWVFYKEEISSITTSAT